MADYALSHQELAAACRAITADADRAAARLDTVRDSGIGTLEFGGEPHAAVGRHYGTLFEQVVPALVNQYADACRALAADLSAALAGYTDAEHHAAAALARVPR